jgi:hypothetical protein
MKDINEKYIINEDMTALDSRFSVCKYFMINSSLESKIRKKHCSKEGEDNS